MSMITEQVKRLRDLADVLELSTGGYKTLIKELKEAADTIEQLAAKVQAANMERSTAYYNGGWIPVSERLPKADEYIEDVSKYYLVQNEYGDMLVARYTRGEYWEQMYQLKPIADEIIAWMPLPDAYREDEK